MANDKQKDDYPYICVLCGGHLAWDSSADASDVLMEYEGDEEAVVNYTANWKNGENTTNNGKK